MSMVKINKKNRLSQSKDLIRENIQKLKGLFPQIMVEDKIDFNILKQIMGGVKLLKIKNYIDLFGLVNLNLEEKLINHLRGL